MDAIGWAVLFILGILGVLVFLGTAIDVFNLPEIKGL